VVQRGEFRCGAGERFSAPSIFRIGSILSRLTRDEIAAGTVTTADIVVVIVAVVFMLAVRSQTT